jgi:hypothetical protein
MLYNHPAYVRFMASERIKDNMHLARQARQAPVAADQSTSGERPAWARWAGKVKTAARHLWPGRSYPSKPQEQCC